MPRTKPSSRGLLGAQSDSLPETKVEEQTGLWLLGGSEVKTVGLGTALWDDSQSQAPPLTDRLGIASSVHRKYTASVRPHT